MENLLTVGLGYFSNIATGIVAWSVCLAFLYGLGLAFVPSHQIKKLNGTPFVILLGAALSTLWYWFGIKLGFPLPILTRALFVLLVLLIFLRKKFFYKADLLDPVFLRRILNFFLLFSFFYVLIYLCLPPVISKDFLPVFRVINYDIFGYINYTAYLQKLGFSNVSPSHMGDYFFDVSSLFYAPLPAVNYAVSAISIFFDHDPMEAAVPTLFGFVALIGCSIARLAQIVFLLPRTLRISLAALFTSSPFFCYVVGNYYLPEIIGILLTLLLLLKTIERFVQEPDWVSQKIGSIPKLAGLLLPYVFLLFYSYVPMSIIGIFLEIVLLFSLQGLLLLDAQPVNFKFFLKLQKSFLIWVLSIFVAITMVALSDINHSLQIMNFSKLILNVHAGWVLDFISPWSILGFPIFFQSIGSHAQIFSIVLFVLFVGALGFFVFIRDRRSFPLLAKAFFLMSVMGFFIYFLYAFYKGPSYQQWKFASYMALPFSFVLCAIFISLILKRWNGSRDLVLFACIVVILCRCSFYNFIDVPLNYFSSDYSNLKALNMIDASDLYIQMGSGSATFFSVYYIPSKRLHLLSWSYYSYFPKVFDLEEVSSQKPLFIEGDSCELSDDRVPISGVGCLFLSPPVFEMNKQFSFAKNIYGLSVTGLTENSVRGRWPDTQKVTMSLLVDPQDLSKSPKGFLNFNLRIPLRKRAHIQHVLISIVGGQKLEATIDHSGWISLPYEARDFQKYKIPKITVDFYFPDQKQYAVGFISVAITQNGLGEILRKT